jgi:4-oxalocrotonate tautomerase
MPLVEIMLWPGRSPEVKEKLMREVTAAVARATGAPPEAVEIIIREVPKTDWCRGGTPYSKTHPDT